MRERRGSRNWRRCLFFFIGRILLHEFDESFPESFVQSIPAENHEGGWNSPHHGFNNPPFHVRLDWISLFQPDQNIVQSEVRTLHTPASFVLDHAPIVGLRDGLDELPIRAEIDDDDAGMKARVVSPLADDIGWLDGSSCAFRQCRDRQACFGGRAVEEVKAATKLFSPKGALESRRVLQDAKNAGFSYENATKRHKMET